MEEAKMVDGVKFVVHIQITLIKQVAIFVIVVTKNIINNLKEIKVLRISIAHYTLHTKSCVFCKAKK